MDKNDILEKVSSLTMDIEKSKLLLSELLIDYSSDERLNPAEAFKYGTTVPNPSKPNEIGEKSFFWILDHKKIMDFISISYDYILKVEEEINSIFEE
ncbi:hypothetical protein J2Z35_001240 [Acetoanaerobium pronyense]|uniref:Uncharacterized protein n=1 Tax=Acetoanaerobium pronyense TaxID=1482736 RepID=A0ABS4KI38_9FIRM|nr:hypothetical protein [Acetoanaerobium pronyense]MBP2027446.1 hypothetical protein [Acetoanaerobium pronyense]